MNAISNTAAAEAIVGRKDRPHLSVSVVNSTTLKAMCLDAQGTLRAEVLVGMNDEGYSLGHVTRFAAADNRFDGSWARNLILKTLSCERAERILKA